MPKPLSEQLAELSVRAKHAEDVLAAAKKEAHDKVVARTEQARAAATAAAEKVNRDIQSAKDTATKNWSAVRAKIAADINNLKADVAHKKHDLDAKLAEKHADELDWEAGIAIDYAVASIQQAEWAALDAVAARAQANKAKAAGHHRESVIPFLDTAPQIAFQEAQHTPGLLAKELWRGIDRWRLHDFAVPPLTIAANIAKLPDLLGGHSSARGAEP